MERFNFHIFFLPAYTISIDVYHRAAFFWAFKTMFALSGGGFVSYLQLPSQGGFKKDYKYNAVMKVKVSSTTCLK